MFNNFTECLFFTIQKLSHSIISQGIKRDNSKERFTFLQRVNLIESPLEKGKRQICREKAKSKNAKSGEAESGSQAGEKAMNKRCDSAMRCKIRRKRAKRQFTTNHLKRKEAILIPDINEV